MQAEHTDNLRRLFAPWAGRRCWLLANASKAPCDRHGRPLAGWPTKGATLDEALKFVDGKRVIGVGLNLSIARDLLCVDCDGGYIADEDAIDSLIAAALLSDVPSYCEISCSGRGLHLFYIAPSGYSGSVRAGRHELYAATERFILTTGRMLGGFELEPAQISLELVKQTETWIHEFARPPEPEPVRPVTGAAIRPVATGGRLTAAQARGLIEYVARQREGNRNSATFWAACRLRDAGASCDIAIAALLPAATSAGLPEREARRTIASAFGARGAA